MIKKEWRDEHQGERLLEIFQKKFFIVIVTMMVSDVLVVGSEEGKTVKFLTNS